MLAAYSSHAGPSTIARWRPCDEIELVVQVNGKVRGKIHVSRDIAEDAALSLAQGDEGIARFLTGPPRKIIFVPAACSTLWSSGGAER